MLIAEICWQTSKQVPVDSYFKKTLEIKGSYIQIDSVDAERWVAREEAKIRQEYGDDITKLTIHPYF